MVTFLVEQMKFSTLNDSIARKQFVKIAGILSWGYCSREGLSRIQRNSFPYKLRKCQVDRTHSTET